MSATDLTSAYSDGTPVTRRIRVGGVSKTALLARLESAGVRLNEFGLALFADHRFTTAPVRSVIEIVEMTVAGLGLHGGATFAQIIERAGETGLSVCPLELGPHFRLQYTDQPEGSLEQPPSRHRAPPGSITVASAPLSDNDDEDTPKGFYLRRIEGVLWLRGYRSWAGHLWSPDDVLAFSRPRNAA